MQYQVIQVTNVLSGTKALEKLVKEVNNAIALGWEPIGGVAFNDGGRVMQAMIKRR